MIGWYLHHHGRGHLQRLRAVAPLLDEELTVFSSLPAEPVTSAAGPARWVQLPADNTPESGCSNPARADPSAAGALHWAPLLHRGHAQRLAAIAAAAPRLNGLVVDVSAEVTILARLLGLPVALFTQPGNRTDAAHRFALDLASVIIAPFPAADVVGAGAFAAAAPHLMGRDRVTCVGAIAPPLPDRVAAAEAPNHDASGADGLSAAAETRPGLRVLVVGGMGGSGLTAQALEQAAGRSRHTWKVLGAAGYPFSTDVAAELEQCDVAVVSAGLGSLAELSRAGRPGLVIAEQRPFDEQLTTGRMLSALGAVVIDEPPAAYEWDELLAAAVSAGPLTTWYRPEAPAEAAAAIRAACFGSAHSSESR